MANTLLERAKAVLPGGINTCIRNYPPDFVTAKAEGAYFWDQNGKKYVDFLGAWGPMVVGYGCKEIKDKVADAVQKYDLYGVGVSEPEVRLAEKITGHMRAVERVLACGSGSEATYHAIRAARAATGRTKIIKMQGAFHGWHDSVLLNVLSKKENLYRPDPFSAGMLRDVYEKTLLCRINDFDHLQKTCEENKGQIAAIIIDPFNTTFGCLKCDGNYLKQVRELCDQEGIYLIFDEVVTGFRVALGGATSFYDVDPDLTCLGKAIGNGFPVAAVGGKKEIMETFNTVKNGNVSYQATYYGNPIMAAAGVATIEKLESPGFYEHLNAVGDRFADGLRAIAHQMRLPISVVNQGSLIGLYFGPGPYHNYDETFADVDCEASTRFRTQMTERGFLIHPDPFKRIVVSYSHSEEDIDQALAAAEDILQGMYEEGGQKK